MDTKKCPKCKQVKTIDCFGEVWDHWKDRYKTESKCKACHKEYCKEYQSRRNSIIPPLMTNTNKNASTVVIQKYEMRFVIESETP